MESKSISLVMISLLFYMSLASDSLAGNFDFCTGVPSSDSVTCLAGKVDNGASVIVKKVTVIQLESETCARVEKVRKKDLNTRGSENMKLIEGCAYHVKFKTTSGCTGKKHGTIAESGENTGVHLTGACGSLKISVRDTKG